MAAASNRGAGKAQLVITAGKAAGGNGKGLICAGTALLALLAAAFAASLVMASRAASPDPDPNGAAAESGCPVDWDYWTGVNPDVIAWVEIPGTGINQPVVQAPADDPTYYLTHDVYRTWNLYGCPYVDAACPNGIDSWSTVISGHNISTPPAMFHDLELFHDPGFSNAHRSVTVHTPAGTQGLTVAGTRTIGGWEKLNRVSFDGWADFASWRDAALAAAGTQAPAGPSRLLTLCSCSYFVNPRDERTLVYALPKDDATAALGAVPRLMAGVASGSAPET